MTAQRLSVAAGAWPALWGAFDPLQESVAFVVGRRLPDGWAVDAFWPTENRWQERAGGRDASEGYSIGRDAWKAARERARGEGLEVLGHAHTHVGDNAVPSFWDVRAVKAGDLGAVWHLGSGRVYWFTTAAGADGKRRLEPVACDVAELSHLMRAWQDSGFADPLATAPKGWPRARRLPPMVDTPELVAMSERSMRAVDAPGLLEEQAAAAGAGPGEVTEEFMAPLRAALATHR